MAENAQNERLPVVRPRRAFAWTCPFCNAENLDRAVEVVFDDPEEEAEVRAQLEMEEHEKVVTTPDSATCCNCLAMVRLSVCDCPECVSEDGEELSDESAEEEGVEDGDEDEVSEVDDVFDDPD